MYSIITEDEFIKRIDFECLSISDYIEIQTYIESNYPNINYYKSETNPFDPHFTIVIYEDEGVLNMIDIYKNTDEYFFIKNYIQLKYVKVDDIWILVDFPMSSKFFVADQVDGLVLFIHDIIDVILNKKENNIRRMLQSLNHGVFDLVYDHKNNDMYYNNFIITHNNGEKGIFRMLK